MKANEAPDKIYFTSTEDGTHYYTEGIPFEREYVEYSQTDAFIEKACEYLMEYEFNDSPTINDRRKRVDEFRKYMEKDDKKGMERNYKEDDRIISH